MSIGIDFVLRANSTAFTRGVASANNAIKDLKKGLKDFDVGNGLKTALGVGGVIAGFRAAISNAQELRDEAEKTGRAMDDATRSVAAYGDALDDVWKGAKNLATETLSFFTRAGEGWGMLINRMRGVSAEQEKIAAGAARGAAEQEKAASALYAKKTERAKTVDADIAAQDEKNANANLSKEELRNKLLAKREEIFQRIDNMGPENKDPAYNVARKEAQLEASRLTGEIGSLGRDLQDEAEREQKRKAEEAAKRTKDIVDKFAPSVEQLANMEVGGFAKANDPRLQARKILETEKRAAMLGSRGDIAGAIKLGTEADKMRKSLESQTGSGTALTAETAEQALKNALESTNKELEGVREQLKGLIKAQK